MELDQNRKGIILAGGLGSRLSPVTKGISKHLLPLYDKPMIYYPLSCLMLAGVREVLIITKKIDYQNFYAILSDGKQIGLNISYEVQDQPLGIPHAFLLAEKFIGNDPVILILGDNFFHGSELISKLQKAYTTDGARIFVHAVKEPGRYGVAEFNKDKKIERITEKPKYPKSNYAITGIYFFDNTVISKAKKCKFSERGELEIVDVLNSYLIKKKLYAEFLGRGNAWIDAGTWETFYEASTFIKAVENRQGQKIGCPEEIAFRNKWIGSKELVALAKKLPNNEYKQYLSDLCVENNNKFT